MPHYSTASSYTEQLIYIMSPLVLKECICPSCFIVFFRYWHEELDKFILLSSNFRLISLTQCMHFKLLSESVKHTPVKVCVYVHKIRSSDLLTVLLEYDWFHLIGLIHDCGKVLALWGEPQVYYL